MDDQEQLRLRMQMEAEEEAASTPSEHLSDSGGVKRLALHKVAPELPGDALPPEKMADADLLKAYLSPHSTSGAFGQGVTKGGTLGFADEIYGLLGGEVDTTGQMNRIIESVDEAKRKGTYDPGAAIDPIPQVKWQLKREGQPTQTLVRPAASPSDVETQNITPLENYRSNREAMRADQATAQSEHPVAFGAGEFAGSMAVPLPGPGKAKGLAKVGKYALQGAGIGAVAGLGNSDADVTGGNIGAALLDTTKGAGAGAALGGVLGYGASKIDPVLERMAARRAYKAMEPYMETIKNELGDRLGRTPRMSEIDAEAQRLGRRMLDEGIIPEGPLSRWANAEDIADTAANKLDEAGTLKGAYVDHAQDQLAKSNPLPYSTSAGRFASEIENAAHDASLHGDKQDLARALQREARNIRTSIINRAEAGYADPAAQTLQEAEKSKTAWQKAAFRGRGSGATQEARQIVARLAKEQAEKAIESNLGPEELETFQALKGRYGDLAKISNTANHGALRSFRNNTVNLGDKLAAQVGAHAAAGPAAIPAAIATAGAHHLVNHRGSAALARTLANASKSNNLLTPVSAVAPWESLLKKDEEKK